MSSYVNKSIKKHPAKKSNVERYKYDVSTNNAVEEEIDFVTIKATLIDKTKHNKSHTQKSRGKKQIYKLCHNI
jgi:hypothetical protein